MWPTPETRRSAPNPCVAPNSPRLVGRVLLAVGSTSFLLLALLGAEAVARVSAPDYLLRTRGLHVFSKTYGWAPRKDTGVTIDGNLVSLNRRGYRGRDLGGSMESGRTRVVVLGDSIAFGLNVSDEQTFPHLLDAHDNGIEVANLAVQGYGPDQELLVLLHDGLRLEPDVVVLAFCLANDFAEAILSVSLYDGRAPKPRFRVVEDRLVLDDSSLNQSATQRAGRWLSDYSHLFNRVTALEPGAPAPLGPHWRERYEGALHDESYALRLNLALVRKMNALCQERGITLLVAAFPDRFSYGVKPRLAERFFAALEGDGVPIVDMSARFRGRGLRFKAIALDGTGHLSPLGHLIVSQELEREIAPCPERKGRVAPGPEARPGPGVDVGG